MQKIQKQVIFAILSHQQWDRKTESNSQKTPTSAGVPKNKTRQAEPNLQDTPAKAGVEKNKAWMGRTPIYCYVLWNFVLAFILEQIDNYSYEAQIQYEQEKHLKLFKQDKLFSDFLYSNKISYFPVLCIPNKAKISNLEN